MKDNIINLKLIENKNFKDKPIRLTYDELSEIMNSYHAFANKKYGTPLKKIIENYKERRKLQPSDIQSVMNWKSICGRYLNALDKIGLAPAEEEEILEVLKLDINENQIVAKRQPNLYKYELEEYNSFKEFKQNRRK